MGCGFMKPPRYTIEIGVSISGFGVLWPVVQHHGQCGCGQVEMKRTVGYFCSHADAEAYVSMATYLEAQAADKHGDRTV
jgi:hypothetical protein